MTSEAKPTTKELIKRELKEVLIIVVYLAACFSVIATFKGLVLAQQGLNEFVHFYSVAIVEALVLSKVVVLAEKLPFLRAYEKRPLIWSVLYKSFLLTVIVELADIAEEKLFVSITGHNVQDPIHPVILLITHACCLMLVFLALFIVRELNDSLGHGKLARLVLGQR